MLTDSQLQDTQNLMKKGQEQALKLFHEASVRVPAYKDFLKRNGVNPKLIKTGADFKLVPTIDKKNYLREYSLRELSWDGQLFDTSLISVSSGSSGQPFFWPRGQAQFKEAADIYEKMYRDIYHADKNSTLVVVCFSMGLWVAGSYTMLGALDVASRGYSMHVVTPAIEKDDALLAIANLHKNYDQVILAGYPPLIKDLIDEGVRQEFNWKDVNVKLMFAGELVSEEWRQHVIGNFKNLKPIQTSNIYGTADAGIIGYETPVTITARKLFNRNKTLTKKTFGTDIVPTIIQYSPEQRYFELVNNELVFTASAGLPLIRYNIHDSGGLLTVEDLLAPLGERVFSQFKQNEIQVQKWLSPVLFLHGRADLTISLYGLMIFPENIKAGLQSELVIQNVTGKFSMMTKYKSNQNQYFQVNVELNHGVRVNRQLKQQVKQEIVSTLLSLNTEYRRLHKAIGKKAEPEVILHARGAAPYFNPGNKHRWVIK